MSMHTEIYCSSLDDLDREGALADLTSALARLRAHGARKVADDGMTYDNEGAISSAEACLAEGANVDRVRLIRAIHEATMQLGGIDDATDADVRAALEARMIQAGHVGFDAPGPGMR